VHKIVLSLFLKWVTYFCKKNLSLNNLLFLFSNTTLIFFPNSTLYIILLTSFLIQHLLFWPGGEGLGPWKGLRFEPSRVSFYVEPIHTSFKWMPCKSKVGLMSLKLVYPLGRISSLKKTNFFYLYIFLNMCEMSN
jgi:hypothetical protein